MAGDLPDTARVCSSHVICWPLGSQAVAYVPDLDEGEIVDSDTARLLSMCSEFRTLDDHVRRLGVADAAAASIRERLALLAGAGLLVTEDQCVGDDDEETAGIESVGIVTADRPDRLQRALDSLAGALERGGRPVRLVVADDSTTADASASNRAIVNDIGRRVGTSTVYLGPGEKRRLAEALAAATGVAAPIVLFALAGEPGLGTTVGANRNALLLATAGELTLQADDDVLWRIAEPAGCRPGVRNAGPAEDPTVLEFHPDRAAALDACAATDRSAIDLHGRFLGRSLGSCLARESSPDRPLIEGAIDHGLARHLVQGRGRVIATSLGIAGDCGMWSPQGLLLLRGASRSNLLARYDVAVRSREIVRAARQTTLVRGGGLMGAAIGLDNRALLPPFFPVGRNEDGVFGQVAPLCLPDGYFVHLPWVVPHDPDTVRSWAPDAVWAGTWGMRLSTLVAVTMTAWTPGPAATSPVDRAIAVAQHLEEIATMSVRDLATWLRERSWLAINGAVRALETNAREVGGDHPGYARDLARQLETLYARVTATEWLEPVDVTDVPVGQRLARVQALLARYGAVLRHWPALRDAARTMGGLAGPPR